MTPAEDLAHLGHLEETVVILGKKFAWRTLDSDEEASAKSAAAPFMGETKERIEKIEKMARAIQSIDTAPFVVSEEEKGRNLTPMGKARLLIYKWQGPVVDRVYSFYEKLEKRREEVIAEFEKNAASPTTSSGVGK